jgi:hypothetical protein
MNPVEMVLAALLERLEEERPGSQSFIEVAHYWQDEGGGG